MKPHYFEQMEADADDMILRIAKAQGYVPPTCLLGGPLVMVLIQEGKDPCNGCECDLKKCNGRDFGRGYGRLG